MKIALIADAFPPMRTSAAVQIRDLAHELYRQGHQPVVLVPDADIDGTSLQQDIDGVTVIRFKTPKTKDVSYVRRTISEFFLPYVMAYRIQTDVPSHREWEGILWYSPTIFFGPLVRFLKRRGSCRSYLILRDIFPEWAVNVGLMQRGLPYRFFKFIERRQYLAADVIGVQAKSEIRYIENSLGREHRRTEVLQNWLAVDSDTSECTLKLPSRSSSQQKRFVYAGNMGKAQNADVFLDLAERISDRAEAYFYFVGRGSEVDRLRKAAADRNIRNVQFHDEIAPDEIAGLLAQCDCGIVSLDPRLKTHNIPGKFLTYMQAGIPVLARINAGNDLVDLIRTHEVGTVASSAQLDDLEEAMSEVIDLQNSGVDFKAKCQKLAAQLFTVEVAARQIVSGLAGRNS